MNPTEMKDALAAEPFKPFIISYPSGRQIGVSSADQAILSGDKRTLVIAKPSDQGGIDLLDVVMIESIEFQPEQPKPRMWWITPNGH
ncbi:MAG: hypothetical protein AAGI68_05040 [Planctomycetota bacterium]